MIVSKGRCATALLIFAFPIAALADLSQTTSVPMNSTLNLEIGVVSAAGAAGTPDILWNASGITPLGNATAVNVGVGAYDVLSLAVLNFTPGFSKNSIPARELVVNDAFAVRTNGNH